MHLNIEMSCMLIVAQCDSSKNQSIFVLTEFAVVPSCCLLLKKARRVHLPGDKQWLITSCVELLW